MKKIDALIKQYALPHTIYVTQPTMPDFERYKSMMKKIWQTKLLSNYGEFHHELERHLLHYLGVKYCSLFCNGTLALLSALKALGLKGEVITTPFSFPATANVLKWLNLKPVFCDIEEATLTINPDIVDRLITRKTSAILPVHVYGNPCDVDAIQNISNKHGLKVIYDAAHAFGVRLKEKALVQCGDASMVSFHATKLFTTLEGGALIMSDEKLKREVDSLKNFGIADEITVIRPGINAKMNEFQAAFGILQLEQVEKEIAARKQIHELYMKKLAGVPGIILPRANPHVKHNYGYFPVLVKEEQYGMSRDALYSVLLDFNIHTRKYFYPLMSRYPYLRRLPTANPAHLPVAEQAANEVLCLPIYGTLPHDTASRIAEVVALLSE